MKKRSQIWFADFETATGQTKYFAEHGDTRINCWGLMNQSGDIYYNGISLDEFIKCLSDIKQNLTLYFHNASFDCDFLIKYLATHGFKAVNEDEFFSPYTFTFFRSLSKIYCVKLALPSGYGKPQIITIKCTYLLLSASIASLGKDLGINKYENFDEQLYDLEPEDSLDAYPKNYLNYMKRDINIARLAFNNFGSEMQNLINNGGTIMRKFYWENYLTIGSISYELQRRYILRQQKFKYCFKINKWTYELASKFYFGGFTQFNEKYQNKIVNCPNGVSFDINSSYPYSMVQALPISKLYSAKKAPIPKNKKVLEYYHLHIGRAIAKQDNLPCLINWHKINKEFGISFSKQRYVWELANFDCYYLKEEWELLQHFYKFEDIRIKNHYWAIADYPLKEFVNDLYIYKITHKKEGKKAAEHTYKILLNSAYGKHATREKFGDFFICQNKEEYDQLMEKDTLTFRDKEYQILKSHFTFNIPNVWAIPVLKIDDPRLYSNKLIAATITAYSRMALLKMALKMGLKNFLYCDTDSLFFRNLPSNWKELIEMDDYKLGAWKLEHRFKFMFIQGAKAYVVANDSKLENPIKSAYSGISKKWLKRNYSPGIFGNYDEPLAKANLKKVSVPSGIVIMPVDYQPRLRSI